MSISVWQFSVNGLEVVDRECGYVGADDMDEGDIGLVAGDGGTNVYIEGSPQDVVAALERCLAQARALLP